MRPADRLFQIVLLLSRGKVVTAGTLAERLQVSVRTVYRDIQDLVLSGVPLEGEAGVGYRLRRGYQVPPLMFDDDELQSLVFGAEVARAWGDPAMAAAAERILGKIEAVLPERLRPQLTSQRLVVPDPHLPAATTALLGEIRESINRRRRVFLDYRDVEGRITERIVWPLALAYWGPSWTLGAWCELRDGFRSFRIDRITSARMLGSEFPDEAGRRIADYLASAAGEQRTGRAHGAHAPESRG